MNGLDASRSAALRFLQTVVVVDDHAYTVVEEAVESASLGDESIDDEYESIDAPEALDDLADPQEFHTEVVVEAFADLGISCAVLAPDPGEHEADMQRMEKLARRSDIVILDWVLNPRDRTGSTPNVVDQTSLGFIREILREDNAGGGPRSGKNWKVARRRGAVTLSTLDPLALSFLARNARYRSAQSKAFRRRTCRRESSMSLLGSRQKACSVRSRSTPWPPCGVSHTAFYDGSTVS